MPFVTPEGWDNIRRGDSSLKPMYISNNVLDNEYEDSKIAYIVFGSSCRIICREAFLNCGNLREIDTNKVEIIGEHAFSRTDSARKDYLRRITIGSSLREIGQYAFGGHSHVDVIEVSVDNNFFDSRENCNCIVDTSNNTIILGCNTSIIPDSINIIGEGAFADSWLGIPWADFGDSIIIPDSVYLIDSKAFRYQSHRLENVYIPLSVSRIGKDAFNDAFNIDRHGTYHVTYIHYEGSEEQWATITGGADCYNVVEFNASIPRTTDYETIISDRDPYNSYYINDSVLYSKDKKTLIYCSENNTGAIFVKEGTERITAGAFSKCKDISLIYLPDTIKFIHPKAFEECSNLKGIFIDNDMFICEYGSLYSKDRSICYYNSKYSDVGICDDLRIIKKFLLGDIKRLLSDYHIDYADEGSLQKENIDDLIKRVLDPKYKDALNKISLMEEDM